MHYAIIVNHMAQLFATGLFHILSGDPGIWTWFTRVSFTKVHMMGWDGDETRGGHVHVHVHVHSHVYRSFQF